MQFCDLLRQYRLYQEEIDAAVRDVCASAKFIDGPVVADFEREIAARAGVRHAVACANGTDALTIGLLTLGIKPGDEVVVPDFTFVATAECVAHLGAVPVFADVREDDYTIDPVRIEERLTERTKGIIAVSLFGQCADLPAVLAIARRRGLWVVEDAAQSFGAVRNGTPSCAFADVSTTSFFPSKPLGCYGDGGALFTDHDEYARVMRLLGHHGSAKKYVHELVGLNSRLDAIQASVLRVKLRHFNDELRLRNDVAAAYTEKLEDRLAVPRVSAGNTSTWAQYTVRSPDRERLRDHLSAKGIPTVVHYPVPLHRQPAFAALPPNPGGPPSTEKICGEVFSLPLHPFLNENEIDEVVQTIGEALD